MRRGVEEEGIEGVSEGVKEDEEEVGGWASRGGGGMAEGTGEDGEVWTRVAQR